MSILEDVWRAEWPHVLGALLRRDGDVGRCEDAAQEAFEAAARQWGDAPPDNPRGWLIRVGSRRLIDRERADAARAEREEADAVAPAPGAAVEHDDSLELLLLACHPALTRPSQVALTLRLVCGLDAAAIAAAFLVPEATMAQRLSRARTTLRDAGARFELPAADELPGAAGRGARRPVPALQRGLHAHGGRRAARHLADERGDPPRRGCCPTTTRSPARSR